jgi:hypothetical protein
MRVLSITLIVNNNMLKRLLILANFLNHFSIISEQTIIPNPLLWAETILSCCFLLESDDTLIPSSRVLPFLWPAFPLRRADVNIIFPLRKISLGFRYYIHVDEGLVAGLGFRSDVVSKRIGSRVHHV